MKWYMRWRAERACHKVGGHYWKVKSSPRDLMGAPPIELLWKCTNCTAERRGFPQDGE